MTKPKAKPVLVAVTIPEGLMDKACEMAERAAEIAVSNEIAVLRRELRREITELKAEMFKVKAIPEYRNAFMKYGNFEENMIAEKFEAFIADLSLKTGRPPRGIRIKIKNMGLLGV